MRRSVLLLLAVLIVFPLNADMISRLISFDEDQPAVLPVDWDLESLADTYGRNITILGPDKQTEVLGNELPLNTDASSAGIMTGEGTAYLKWEIEAPIPVTIQLQSTGAMTALDSRGRATGSIHWTASWGNHDDTDQKVGVAEIQKNNVGGSASNYGTRNAVIHKGTLDAPRSSGICQIDITTVNAYDAVPAAYSGILTLIIEGL